MPENHIFPLPPEYRAVWKAIQTPRLLAKILQSILPESQEAPLTEGNVITSSLMVVPETRGHFPMVEFSAWRGDSEILECEVVLCTNGEMSYPLLEEARSHLREERKHRDANCFSKRNDSIKKTVHVWIQINAGAGVVKMFGSGSFAGYLLYVPGDIGEAAEHGDPAENILYILHDIANGGTV